ncbi:hypothetical protein [Heliophilum fasciatum]|uniref:Chemotaxis phosphatase CheX-like protein n=1 Tax=Heliophilum fasciatum TaxID=35700 RepID=A0A4R2RWV4_9FIRM|nr:hypothetical protein [Heliophilum fasciatum]MCW2276667.1 hypothetical protein [Heliophilum fasciatum]TCP68952.1 hypothetical protein EDD73_101118 [Heliophilum fasciatum]
MYRQYFYDFIHQRNILTLEQLDEVLAAQQFVRVKLGLLAIDSDYMTGAQVDRIHRLQRASDKSFGEIAIQEGFLTIAQMEELFDQPIHSYLTFSQVLVNQGFFDYEQIERLIDEYKSQSTSDPAAVEPLQKESVEMMMDELTAFETTMEFADPIFGSSLISFVKVIKFIEASFQFGPLEKLTNYDFEYLMFSVMQGDYTVLVGVGGNFDKLNKLARLFAESMNVDDNEMADSLCELLNIVGGMVEASLAQRGVMVELLPPVALKRQSLCNSKPFFRIPVHMTFGHFDYLIAEGVHLLEQQSKDEQGTV